MADTTAERLPKTTGEIPHRGTYSMAANTLLYKGQIVTQDSAGRAAVPGAGQNAIGISASTYNNRTGAPSGGAADAMKAEVEYGVQGLAFTGTAPTPGDVVYVVDNQTVSLDPTGSRGIAGICSETKNGTGDDGLCYVFMGPLAVAIATGAQAAVSIDIPLGGWRLSTGAAIPAFGNGTADGFSLVGSEGLAIRINDDSTTVFAGTCRLPESLPANAALSLHILVSRVGSSDPTTAKLTPHVYRNREGAAYDAGNDLVTGDTALLDAATTVMQELTVAIDQNGGAKAGDVLTVTLAAKVSPGLDNDDANIHAVWIEAR
jgi:hypothetical protein